MSPLPKWLAKLSILAAAASVAWSMYHPGQPEPQWITTITTLVAAFSHSLTGTGGKPVVAE